MVRHRTIRHVILLVLAMGLPACASRTSSAPVALRGGEFRLQAVDGQPVRGTQPVAVTPGSPEEQNGCRDRIADGTLQISRDGRSFTFRSTMRDCSGAVLLTESNEGLLERRDSTLAFLIHGNEGAVTFRGNWDDATVRIFQLGGLLEFARPQAVQ